MGAKYGQNVSLGRLGQLWECCAELTQQDMDIDKTILD